MKENIELRSADILKNVIKDNPLVSQEDRVLAVNSLSKAFLKEMQMESVKLSDKAHAIINSDRIILSIREESSTYSVFASEIELYAPVDRKFSTPQPFRLSYGSSGSFTNENEASVWRTLHAAEVVKNWDLVGNIVTAYCAAYEALQEMIFNNKK